MKKAKVELEALPSDTPAQIAAKTALYSEAEDAVAKLNAAADVPVAVELQGLKGRAYEQEREKSADHMMLYWAEGLSELQAYARDQVFAHKLAVFAFSSYEAFAAIQSSFHYHWAWEYCSTMRRDIKDTVENNFPELSLWAEVI